MSLDELRLPGIAGRTAAVTGAGRGIGREVARVLHAQGANVALLDVSAAEDAPWFDDRSSTFLCDVTDEDSVDAAVTSVEERFGPVDILVNNAGVLIQGSMEELTLQDWQTCIDVNLTGAFLCARRVLPAMRERGYGRLVHIGSSAGKTGGSRAMAAYAAAKAGVMTLSRSIASEYAPFGVTSNALAPTLISTPMIAGLSDLADLIPVGRLGQPEDVAFMVAVLASEAASYVTGEVTDVNGGFLID